MEKNDHLVGYWIDKSLSVALGFPLGALLLGCTCARLCTWSLSKVIRVNKQLHRRKLVTRLQLFPSGDETACFVRTLKTSSWSGIECCYFLTGREKRKVAENTLAILNSDGLWRDIKRWRECQVLMPLPRNQRVTASLECHQGRIHHIHWQRQHTECSSPRRHTE